VKVEVFDRAVYISPGRVAAPAHPARDAGTRSRGDTDGPVFATVIDGIGSLPAALVALVGAEPRHPRRAAGDGAPGIEATEAATSSPSRVPAPAR